jgi:hypothetical protein
MLAQRDRAGSAGGAAPTPQTEPDADSGNDRHDQAEDENQTATPGTTTNGDRFGHAEILEQPCLPNA